MDRRSHHHEKTRGATPPNGRHTQTPSTYNPVFVPLRRHPRPMALASKCPRRKVGGFSARAARCPRRSTSGDALGSSAQVFGDRPRLVCCSRSSHARSRSRSPGSRAMSTSLSRIWSHSRRALRVASVAGFGVTACAGAQGLYLNSKY